MVNEKKLLGVIGGLGPGATAHFMNLVTHMTDAAVDQEHLEMIVFSCPSIPDRTRHILDNSQPSPLPRMLEIGNKLTELGARQIAIPCVTAHYFYDALTSGIRTPIINGVALTAAQLKEHGIARAGIMATSGTIQSGIFHRELEKLGIEPIAPSEPRQADVTHIIFDNIKAGLPADMARFHAVARELTEKGAQAIILGCTELSLVKRDNPIGPGFIDAMEVLAQQSILRCGGPLKEAYIDLISK